MRGNSENIGQLLENILQTSFSERGDGKSQTLVNLQNILQTPENILHV